MEFLFKFIYRFAAYPAFLGGARIGARWNQKLKRGLEIHAGSLERWQQKSQALPPSLPRIWFHAPSTGEMEQARPVIEEIRRRAGKTVSLILSYYSPTVEAKALAYTSVDLCEILPLDTPSSVDTVLDDVKPSIIVFVKFDTWPCLVWQASRRNIPLCLIDATLREKSFRVSNFLGRSFSRSLYRRFAYIGAVSEPDMERFESLTRPGCVKTVGDTRFDRVKSRKESAGTLRIPAKLCKPGQPVLICGSTWEGDEERVIPAVSALLARGLTFQTLLVPHEPSADRLRFIAKLLDRHKLPWKKYSAIQSGESPEAVTVLDAVGFLAELYRIGTFCYVGGAFLLSGVHNCMEPAVMGMPLCFGPNYQNAPEAEEMVRLGVAHPIRTAYDIERVVALWLSDPGKRADEGGRARAFVEKSTGVARVYANDILELIR